MKRIYMSRELLSFNCGETFPNNYKPIAVQLWVVYKVTRASPVTNTFNIRRNILLTSKKVF